MRSINDALTYPMESDEWITTIIIGGVLMFLGFLLIPLFVVYGYLVRVIRGATAGRPEPPTFGDWGQLIVDGIQAFIIGFIFMLIPIIVATFTVGGAIAAMATGTDAGVAAGLGGMFVGLGISFLLSLVFGYVAVAALVNFAREDRFGAAFEIAVLKDVVLNRDYALAWVMSVIVFIGAGVIASVLNVIPLVGAVIGALIGFYAAVVAATLWADGFSDALGQSDSSDHPIAEESVV